METYNVGSGVHLRQHTACICGWDYKVGDNGDSLNLLGPLEFLIVANVQRWLRRLFARVNATRRGRKNLTERNLYAGNIFWFQLIQVRPDKATEERRSDIIRMALWVELVR